MLGEGDPGIDLVLGGEMPDGVRFVGPTPDSDRGGGSRSTRRPTRTSPPCVACGLCLPHCPTYRVTGEESASPRGRITAMRSVADGLAQPDEAFARFMDLCLACRACEDVCPSHVPFGRMMERARVQIEPLRTRRARVLRWLGLEVALPSKKVLWLLAALQPIGRVALPGRVRALTPRRSELFRRLPAVTEPVGDERGTVALLSGCVQGPVVPRGQPRHDPGVGAQRLAGRHPTRPNVLRALAAHHGRLDTARTLAERNLVRSPASTSW
jgi:glycolate oxidase iron-sulfur subunit